MGAPVEQGARFELLCCLADLWFRWTKCGFLLSGCVCLAVVGPYFTVRLQAVDTFAAGGVDIAKLVRIPEPVDVNFFNPSKYTPLPLEWYEPTPGDQATHTHSRRNNRKRYAVFC